MTRDLLLNGFALLGVALVAIVFSRHIPAPLAYGPEAELNFEAAAAAAPPADFVPVPILVYHIVRPEYPSDSAGVKKLRLTPETFAAELGWLKADGYHVVSFAALVAHLSSGAPLPDKPIVLTFDDAWEDQYQYAFPILTQYKDAATFFIPSGFPGSNAAFITWDQLRDMVAGGMSVGSHSKTHPYLTRVGTTTLAAEIAGSKATLEAELHVPITFFAYPFGQYDAAVIAALGAAGYTAARADALSPSNTGQGLYALPALNAPTSLALFKRYFP